MNVDQTVWRGFEALEPLSKQDVSPDLAVAAGELYGILARSARGGPLAAFIATRGEGVADKDVRAAMDRLIAEAERLPSFQQPAFQCLAEFKQAVKAGHSRFMSGFALAVCLTERVFKVQLGG